MVAQDLVVEILGAMCWLSGWSFALKLGFPIRGVRQKYTQVFEVVGFLVDVVELLSCGKLMDFVCSFILQQMQN